MNVVEDAVARWRARGERVAVATVVAARRSAPRPVGAKLAVSERGEVSGSVSGGCVEPDVVEHAREVLAGAPPRLVSYGIDDDVAWTVGLPCGGEIDVFIEELGEGTPLGAPAEGAIVTALTGEGIGLKELVRQGDAAETDAVIRTGRSGVIERGGERYFCEVSPRVPRLVVIGAVDLAEELCRAARNLGWPTFVADPRSALASEERLPAADEIVVAWPDEALEQAAPDEETAVIVLTHDEKLDAPALAAALRSDAFYVGALGSRRTQARRRERLLEAGFHEEELDRIAAPCGLDIGAETPAETAVSIVAEILAVRAGRSGGRLRDASGSIHAVRA